MRGRNHPPVRRVFWRGRLRSSTYYRRKLEELNTAKNCFRTDVRICCGIVGILGMVHVGLRLAEHDPDPPSPRHCPCRVMTRTEAYDKNPWGGVVAVMIRCSGFVRCCADEQPIGSPTAAATVPDRTEPL